MILTENGVIKLELSLNENFHDDIALLNKAFGNKNLFSIGRKFYVSS